MNQRINNAGILEGLVELSSIEEQRRLWLSDGSSGVVSSFVEALEGLFTDTGLSAELEAGRCVFGEPVDAGLKRLSSLSSRIDANRAPHAIIEDAGMAEVRSTAAGLLNLLRSDL